MNIANVSNIDVFADYIHEDVLYCEIEDVFGGISDTGIYYCYQPFISDMKVPPIVNSEYSGTIKSISCLKNRGFKRIRALVESGSIQTEYNGQSDETLMSFFLLGNKAEFIGLSRKLRHRPFTIIVVDNNQRKFVIGTLVSPAYLKNFEIDSGKKFDDNCGAMVTFSTNAIFYELTGNIPSAPSALFGDFDLDFDEDFN